MNSLRKNHDFRAKSLYLYDKYAINSLNRNRKGLRRPFNPKLDDQIITTKLSKYSCTFFLYTTFFP